MSHFSALVIGSDVEEALAPYHEFECTGEDDQYVQDIDKTAEACKKYEIDTTRKLRGPDGTLHCPWSDEFYREPLEIEKSIGMFGSGCGDGVQWSSRDWNDGLGYRAKVHFIPEGWEEVEVKTPEVQSFAEWASDYYGSEIVGHGAPINTLEKHKYGFIQLGENGEVEKIIDRTNPNKKWDWYEVGGRMRGFLLKDGTQSNQATMGEIDFNEMRAQASLEASNRFESAMEIIGALPPNESWDSVRDRNGENHDAARSEYWAQPRCVAWKAAEQADFKNWQFGWSSSPDDYSGTLESYVSEHVARAVTAFAVVKDGKWFERGEMGWWACVSGEKDQETWNDIVKSLLDGLPAETMVSMVDCHI